MKAALANKDDDDAIPRRPVTLKEAMAAYGPLIGHPEVDAMRERAAKVLSDALARIARSALRRSYAPYAEDACGEVLFKLCRIASKTFASDAALEAWLRKVMLNWATDQWRREWFVKRSTGKPRVEPIGDRDWPAAPERESEDSDEATRTGRAALRGLAPPSQLHDFDDLCRCADNETTIEEVAAATGRSRNATSVAQTRLRAHLAEAIRRLPEQERPILQIALNQLRQRRPGRGNNSGEKA